MESPYTHKKSNEKVYLNRINVRDCHSYFNAFYRVLPTLNGIKFPAILHTKSMIPMEKRKRRDNMSPRFSAPALACLLLLFVSVFSAAAADPVSMTAGEVKPVFVEAGTNCVSTDPDIAWVDTSGNLNAMKAGIRNQMPALQTIPAGYMSVLLKLFHRWYLNMQTIPFRSMK